MSVTIAAMPSDTVVELVNEWGTVPREAAGEGDQPFPAARGMDFAVPEELASVLDTAALRRAADLLHPAFAATTATECAERVTALLAAAGVRPVLGVDDDRVRAEWTVNTPRHAVAAAAALMLRDHLDRHGFTRLGTCAGRACADAFIDNSPTHDRRYCSVTCQNRARVAAYRSRRARDT